MAKRTFGCIGGILLVSVIGGTIALTAKSCVDTEIAKGILKNRNNNKSSTSSTDVMTQPTTLDIDVTSGVLPSDIEMYFNYDIYNALLNAKANYELLLKNGDSVSEKIINSGVSLNANESGYIDGEMTNIYNLICKYISAYESNNTDVCYKVGTELINSSYSISKNYLFETLVMKNLDSQYQSDIKYDDFGNYVYQYGNLSLDNGKQIRFLGGNDPIVGDTNLSDINSRMEWLGEVPSALFNRYLQITNTDDDGVCYVINTTKASDCCDSIINSIISHGAAQYGFSEDDCMISIVNDEAVFVDSSNQICGLLDYNQKNLYEKVLAVRVAIDSKVCDALLIDSYLNDIYSNENNNSYHK